MRPASDASRLVLPGFRKRLLETLGPETRVGVPNRDFLVAWSRDFDKARQFAAKVAEDSERRPYPLTDEIFVIDERGARPTKRP